MRGIRTARMGIVAAGCAFATFAAQAVTITVDKVQQRWPWNNKVDITYTVADDNLDTHNAKVVLTTVVNGTLYVAYEGDINENAASGTYTVTWENPPTGVKAENCTMTAAYYSDAVPEGDDYMIVELSTGVVKYEGVCQASGKFGSLTGQEISNARYSTTRHYDGKLNQFRFKYKTSHMVLRKIPAGTYYTGDNNATEWTVDKAFYMQLFPYTNYQYWDVFDLISSDRVSSQQDDKARPLTWNDIRGSADPLSPSAPATSGLKNVVRWLNGRVAGTLPGRFDLPTMVMREIACRAGTSTTYFWPSNNAGDAYKYASFGSGYTDVGTKLPNNWGIYDMVGLDWEFCLDVNGGSRAEGHENDPFAPLLGSDGNRVVHGNDCYGKAADMNSARFSSANPGKAQYVFRLAYYPAQ